MRKNVSDTIPMLSKYSINRKYLFTPNDKSRINQMETTKEFAFPFIIGVYKKTRNSIEEENSPPIQFSACYEI
jgi:2-oxo-4-hydroxy-4-carboxy--5-ureidoimidazoline (OHCU) decarboxylase